MIVGALVLWHRACRSPAAPRRSSGTRSAKRSSASPGTLIGGSAPPFPALPFCGARSRRSPGSHRQGRWTGVTAGFAEADHGSAAENDRGAPTSWTGNGVHSSSSHAANAVAAITRSTPRSWPGENPAVGWRRSGHVRDRGGDHPERQDRDPPRDHFSRWNATSSVVVGPAARPAARPPPRTTAPTTRPDAASVIGQDPDRSSADMTK